MVERKFTATSVEELFKWLSRRDKLILDGKRKPSQKVRLQLRPE